MTGIARAFQVPSGEGSNQLRQRSRSTRDTMKAAILAGGLGNRISEETHLKPTPMIDNGGRSILWHIMNIYSAHGVNDSRTTARG